MRYDGCRYRALSVLSKYSAGRISQNVLKVLTSPQIFDVRVSVHYGIPGFQNAEIEFTGPEGTAHKRPLIELSVSGGSFQVPERIPGLEVGTAVAGGVIRFGDVEVRVIF